MTEASKVTIHILVVDDEPDLETLITQRFRKQIRAGNFQFHFSGDGEQALEKLEHEPRIEIIFTDINMPRMDGLTLLGRLGELDLLHKAVVISAYGDMENIRTAMNRGAFDFLTKPIDFQDLEKTLEKTIREVQDLRKGQDAQRTLITMEQELTVAARIQQSILPKAFPEAPQIDLFACMHSAKQVSGDFYDFFWLDEHHLAVVVADVSGKGVPAALFMAVSRTLLRAVAGLKSCPAQCLKRVNELIEPENVNNLFVTMIYGVLDIRTGFFEYTNAGHNLPYHLHAQGPTALPNQGGIVLGILPEISYEVSTLQLEPGDGLLLYTDGVTEAIDQDRNFYGEERLEALLANDKTRTAQELVEQITGDLWGFVGPAPQHDDITVLSFRYNGP